MTVATSDFDIYDNGGGSVSLAWGAFQSGAASYNVYLDGVLNQNVTARKATVAGLVVASYAANAAAASGGNSLRPQNMPPVGLVSGPARHTIHITAVVSGVERGRTIDKFVTPAPSSVMLTTPMRRIYPFPLTGLDGPG